MTLTAHSVTLFVLAGLCEIGGGYLVWQWWRNGAHWGIGLLGAVTLVLYGIVPTYQPAHFGRVYAAYGGWFVVLSILWGWADRSRGSGSVRPRGRADLPGRRRDDHVLAPIGADPSWWPRPLAPTRRPASPGRGARETGVDPNYRGVDLLRVKIEQSCPA